MLLNARYKNHTHALELEFPEPHYADYELAANLRREVEDACTV